MDAATKVDTNVPYPEDKLTAEMWEDHFFLPQAGFHGDDCLVRVYLNDSHCEAPEYDDHNQFEIDYISRSLILESAELDPTLTDTFEEHIYEQLRNFCSTSVDGGFADIVEIFGNTITMTHADMVDWAKGVYKGKGLSIIEKNMEPECKGEYYSTTYICSLGINPEQVLCELETHEYATHPGWRNVVIKEREGYHFYKPDEDKNPAQMMTDIVSTGAVIEQLMKIIGWL